jgi:hypothetical protein
MRTLIFSALLIGGFLQAASVEQTPPNLEAFILRNIGLEEFFNGKNIDAKEILVKKIKDFTYFSFDIFKTVSMTTGITFDQNNKAHHLLLGKQKYSLTLRLEEVSNADTGLKNSVIIFVFTKE